MMLTAASAMNLHTITKEETEVTPAEAYIIEKHLQQDYEEFLKKYHCVDSEEIRKKYGI